MKKTMIILGSILLVIVVIAVGLSFALNTPKNAGSFSVDDFADEIQNENFQTDKNYGPITDYKAAAQAGKTAIAERFGNNSGDLFKGTACTVMYDEAHNAYLVRTYPRNPLTLGGIYIVILQSDGTVLAIWGEK